MLKMSPTRLAGFAGSALLVLPACLFLRCLPVGAAAEPATPTAEIELRKSFTNIRGSGRQPSRAATQSRRQGTEATGAAAASSPPPEVVAKALGEPIQSKGTLHLPLSDGTKAVLPGEAYPVIETTGGRRVVLDAGRTIPADVVSELARLWPDFPILQPPVGAPLREIIGGVLDSAGYASVQRATPLTFGRGAAVRITPDFVVLRGEGDLLHGEIRGISVVEPRDALPAELLELAAEQRVRLVELAPDGTPAGPERAVWRDATGRVTTMETDKLAALLTELAADLGLVSEPSGPDATDVTTATGDTPMAAVRTLLTNSGIPAVGPIVEFYPRSAAGARGRFVISITGWLAERGGRRLLITGASPPLAIRLYLTREGIDIFEYRLR